MTETAYLEDSVVIFYDNAAGEQFAFEVPAEIDLDPSTAMGDDFSWHVTYHFTDEIRNNKFVTQYGSPGMTFRRLYYILCNGFNNGRLIIEDYFESVYANTWCKTEVDNLLAELKHDILKEYDDLSLRMNKRGGIDKRQRSKLKKLSELNAFTASYIEDSGYEIAEHIKESIVDSLMTGIIPLSKDMDEPETIRKRVKAGLPATPRFFASGQFIDNVVITIKLERKSWQTSQGIWV